MTYSPHSCDRNRCRGLQRDGVESGKLGRVAVVVPEEEVEEEGE